MLYRLKPQVERELTALRGHLTFLVKMGAASSDSAMAAYMDAHRQVSRNQFAFEQDTRDWSPVKCRQCAHTTSVLSGTMKYACMQCSPTVAREAFVDMVGRDGQYLITDTVATKPKDTSVIRKQALLDGATLQEADTLIGGRHAESGPRA